MKVDLNKVGLILAEIKKELHRKSVWQIFNENIEYFHLTNHPVSYKNHCLWWEKAFDEEFIFLITYNSEICGYIRLSKENTKTKEKYEISVVLSKDVQNYGIGSIAYKLFENEMKMRGVKEIIAKTLQTNQRGQQFFEKNNFTRSMIRFKKEI